MSQAANNIVNIVFKVLVIVLLSLSYWHIMTLSNENSKIIEKLKFDLEFLKSKQTEISEDLNIVNEKLKYDLEFIKTTQSTMRENHEILLEIVGKKAKTQR